MPSRLGFEHLGQAGRARVVRPESPAQLRNPRQLRLGHERQLREMRVRSGQCPRQKCLEMTGHSLNGRGVEQVGVVMKYRAQPLGALPDVDLQVEARRGHFELEGNQRQPGQPQLLPSGVLDVEDHLEERVPAHVPLELKHLDQLLEGQVLMLVGAQRRLLHARQQLPEGGVTGEVRAQNEAVDEEADQPLDLGPIAVGDGGSHDDVLLPRVAMEESLEGGEEAHEEGHAFPPAQRPHLLGQAGGDLERVRGAAVGLHGRPGAIGR